MNETIEWIGEAIVAVLILLGALIAVISTLGLLRMPDVYTRAHAASKSSTLAMLCILLGAFFFFLFFEGQFSTALLLAVIFVFVTTPVGGHLIGRAAYRSGVPLSDRSVQDDLAAAEPVMRRHSE